MTEDELDEAREEIHELFADVREDLAKDLGGDPDDYRADRAVSDGGK